ncbi:MAG: PepSY-associated TM helix domain-containing protein [Bryobacteraceae bacterium]
MFRRWLFWIHLIAGCLAGAVILAMSVTGVLLTYERQIVAWAERGAFQATVPSGGAPLPLERLLAPHAAILPGAVLTLRSNPREPAELRAGRESTFYIDRYSGLLMGEPEHGTAAFFQTVRAWHRWLGVSGNGGGRDTAKAITGACNLAFLVLVVSGAYLWVPRQWSAQHLRPILWFREGLSGKARDFSWHNVFGVWSLVPLFFVVLTAVPISYTWGTAAIYWLTGTPAPSGPPRRGGPPQRKAVREPVDLAGLGALWARAESQTPGWRSISAPAAPDPGPVAFTIDTGTGGQPQRRSTLVLRRESGEVVRHETFGDLDAGRRLRSYARFLHTGEVLGVTGQTIAGLASLGGAMLVWTGISLALRRLAAWNRRRTRPAN